MTKKNLSDFIRHAKGKSKTVRWTMDAGHRIRVWEKNGRRRILLRGRLAGADATGLAVAFEETKGASKRVRIFRLSGAWEADSKNRLNFVFERRKNTEQRLVFRGTWKLGPSNEILYEWREAEKSKRRRQRLRLRGYWKIGDRHRIHYHLAGGQESPLRFRGAFQTNSILAKEGTLRYQIGLEGTRRKRTRELVFFGKWKYSRDLELSFRLRNRPNRQPDFRFGIRYRWDSPTELAVGLTGARGRALGVEVVLSRDLARRDAGAFLRLKHDLEESRVEGGLSFRW